MTSSSIYLWFPRSGDQLCVIIQIPHEKKLTASYSGDLRKRRCMLQCGQQDDVNDRELRDRLETLSVLSSLRFVEDTLDSC